MPTRRISLAAERDALKPEALRAQIGAGVEALDRGEFVEVSDADLDQYLERLGAAVTKRSR